MTLTEKWKKGELEDGFYYVKEDGKIFISICRKHYLLQVLQGCKVLAPVPSYDEWQPFTDEYFNGLTTKDIAELAKKSIRLTTQHCKDNEENQQLKELLKECREFFEEENPKDFTVMSERMDELLTKIDNAIGEK